MDFALSSAEIQNNWIELLISNLLGTHKPQLQSKEL